MSAATDQVRSTLPAASSSKTSCDWSTIHRLPVRTSSVAPTGDAAAAPDGTGARKPERGAPLSSNRPTTVDRPSITQTSSVTGSKATPPENSPAVVSEEVICGVRIGRRGPT